MRRSLFSALLVLFALLVVAGLARADAPTASGGTCSIAVASNIVGGVDLGDRVFSVTDSVGCFAPVIREVPAGSSFTLTCGQASGTPTPPDVPQTITVKGIADNTGFGNVAATAIWTQTLVGNCATGAGTETFTVYCTSDGTVAGALRYGIVRIQVRAQRTLPVTYDVNSETSQGTPGTVNPKVGLYRCNPKPTTLDAGASPLNPWVGGDTIGLRLAVDSTSYVTQTTGFQEWTCSASPVKDNAAAQFGTSVQTFNVLVAGSASDIQTGCTVKSLAFLNRKSAIALYSTTDFAVWNTAGPPSGVTFPTSLSASFTSNTLNRILTEQSNCAPAVLGTSTSVVNRGQTLATTCRWKDARGNFISSADFGRTWVQRLTQYQVATDVPSFDSGIGASGQVNANSVPATTATVTTGTAYRFMVEWFDTSARTPAVLFGWGNSTNQVDVSATYTFGTTCVPAGCPNGITNAKTSGGANVSAFTISVDTEHVSARDLRDATGNLLSGVPVTCFRTRPDMVTESAVSVGNTNAGGDTADASFSVIAPAGRWYLECDVASNGNTAAYQITFFFTSAFTANLAYPLLWNVTVLPNGTWAAVNVSLTFDFYDAGGSDTVDCAYADDVVRLSVFAYRPSGNDYRDVLTNRTMTGPLVRTDGSLSCVWTDTETFPIANLSRGAFAFATFNFTGAPFLASQGYIFKTQSSSSTGGTVQLSDLFVGSLTLANVLLMLAWFFLFLWTAHRRYIVCAALAWLGVLEPLYAGGLGITFVGTVAIFLVVLMLYVIRDWKESYQADARQARAQRGRA